MNNTHFANIKGHGQVVLLVGIQKGQFHLNTNLRRRQGNFQGPSIASYAITHAWIDFLTPTHAHAAAHHPIWGGSLYQGHDLGCSWKTLPPCASPSQGSYAHSLKALWYLAPVILRIRKRFMRESPPRTLH